MFTHGNLPALLPELSNSALVLYYAVALLRTNTFNYLSLETVLNYLGVLSQIPLHTIFLMSSGCKNVIHCGRFGTIEFVHTNRQLEKLVSQLSYDRD